MTNIVMFSNRQHSLFVLSSISLLAVASPLLGVESPNVLFIAVDDLRPELACCGVEEVVTPNFDRLARRGVRFERAYCNIAVCGASGASLMKGPRPTPTRFTSYKTWAEQDAPEVPSLPMVFKEQGYHTASNGKLYHHRDDDANAWSQPPWRIPCTSMLTLAAQVAIFVTAARPESVRPRSGSSSFFFASPCRTRIRRCCGCVSVIVSFRLHHLRSGQKTIVAAGRRDCLNVAAHVHINERESATRWDTRQCIPVFRGRRRLLGAMLSWNTMPFGSLSVAAEGSYNDGSGDREACVLGSVFSATIIEDET